MHSRTPVGGEQGGGVSTPSTPTTPTTPGASGAGGPGAPSNYNPSAGVEQWRPHVEEGLRRNGLPTSLADQVLHQMQTESSGNPKAINNSDINAINGTPSKGLLQTIDPTFQSHHLPGDANDPYDPQANIDAAINYAKGRYGPTLMNNGQGMGSGHGY
jgi:soluble lytic murein transglycosylase-like protein